MVQRGYKPCNLVAITPIPASHSIIVTMSKPSAGDYVIYNRVLSPTGEKLALSFNGQNQTVTVKPLDKGDGQIVSISSASILYPLILSHSGVSLTTQMERLSLLVLRALVLFKLLGAATL
jgi:hypothetical protein